MTTLSEIKSNNHNAGFFFFSSDTMKFFGDRMTSFRVISYKGKEYVIRKPNCMVNVFGTKMRAGKEFFGAWYYDPETHNLRKIQDGSMKDELFRRV